MKITLCDTATFLTLNGRDLCSQLESNRENWPAEKIIFFMVQNGGAFSVRGHCVVSVKVHKPAWRASFLTRREVGSFLLAGQVEILVRVFVHRAFELCGEPESLTFTMAHLTCLISINTPLYNKHVYLLLCKHQTIRHHEVLLL